MAVQVLLSFGHMTENPLTQLDGTLKDVVAMWKSPPILYRYLHMRVRIKYNLIIAIPCNRAINKSNANLMDAAFSDTIDRLVSTGELLNTRMQNP